YAPFNQVNAGASASSNPLEFYLEGISRPTGGATLVSTTAAIVPALAADAKVIYVSAFYQDQVVCFDSNSGARLRAFDVPQPNGLCLDGTDGLLVVSNKRIVRLDLKSGQLSDVITSGLDQPWHVTVDKAGNLLVTDQGVSQQVKRFDRSGKLLGSYGVAGGRDNQGKYSSTRNKIFFTE
ncbi:MAG: hypothetical protein ABI707_02915, partial [Ferruginibacter sp.]